MNIMRITGNKYRFLQFSIAAAFILLLATSGVQATDRDVSIKMNDLALNARMVSSGEDIAGKEVVLMLHGTLAHGRMEIMSGLQNALKEREINTLSINLSLGQSDRKGMYDCKSLHRHLHEDALDEIDAWLDWLTAQGAKKITLLGHSRGGAQIALFAAERMRDNIAKIILMAPMSWDAGYTAESYKKRYGADLAPLLEKAKSMGEQIMKSVDFIYCPKTDVKASSFVSYYSDDPRKDTPFLLAKINRPVLVVIAGNDQVVKGLAAKIKPLAQRENISMTTISDAGHMFLDFALEDAADAIAEFVAE